MSELRLTAREVNVSGTIITLESATVGGKQLAIIAGPCAVEGKEQLLETARAVKASGAHLLRGGAYKPRTSPYSFEGLKEEGLRLLAEVREETGLGVVTELMDARHLEAVSKVADVLQIGSRNMQNFTLLDEVGMCRTPILLKRGMSATLAELLLAAERVARGGNHNIILCERGIRTFETATRSTLDLNAVPFLKRRSHLPVIVDPSHGTGHWWMVPHLARAAVAVGCDGLIVEVHIRPDDARCDGFQSLTPDTFKRMMKEVGEMSKVMGRTL